jgi:hypothetical protein
LSERQIVPNPDGYFNRATPLKACDDFKTRASNPQAVRV